MDLQLTGKRALVTGGSRGIGKAVARVLADEGCDVAIAARDRRRARGGGGRARRRDRAARSSPSPVDTGDDDSVRAMVAAAVEALGGIDILVNSAARPAGRRRRPKLADITDDAVLGGHERQGARLPALRRRPSRRDGRRRGWGRIINICGLAARVDGLGHRLDAQRRRRRADQEPRRRARPERHQRHRRAPGADPHRGDAGRGRRLAEARGVTAAEAERAPGAQHRSAGWSTPRRSPTSSPSSPRPAASPITGDAIAVRRRPARRDLLLSVAETMFSGTPQQARRIRE